jgi:homocysteine S-methyltransferase
VNVNPGAPDIQEEIRRLERKRAAGAQFAVTAPLFRPNVLEQFVKRARELGMPLIATVRPLTGYREAEFLNNEVPEVSVPETVLTRLRKAGSPGAEREEGLTIAREIAVSVTPLVQGIEVSVPGADYATALDVLGL